MPLPSARDTCLFSLGIIQAICLPSQMAWAGDAPLFSGLSTHISRQQDTPSLELQSFSISKNPPMSGYLLQGGTYSPPAKKSMSDQDLFSLALGARFQISDWLGVDAACSMPLVEEETVWRKDLAIEAMVTMQF